VSEARIELDATKPPQRVTRTQPSGQYGRVRYRQEIAELRLPLVRLNDWMFRRSVVLMAVCVVAVGCGARHDLATRSSARSTPVAPRSTVTRTGPVVYPTIPANAIQWGYRGTLMLEGRDTIDLRAYKVWHAAHPVPTEGDYGPVLPLWSGQVGSAAVFVFETGTDINFQPTPFVAVYVEQAGTGKLIADDVPALNVPALSWTFGVDGLTYTLVLAPSGATISSSTPSPPIAARGNGWAVYRTLRSGGSPRFFVRACATCQARSVVVVAARS
jgi:hypothetical protein